MTFQRARSDEQRAERRGTILTTAAEMLDEMPVADLSLNELSRRVGLAKSNVLRYFDSREGVLLELMEAVLVDWIAEVSGELDAHVEAELDLGPRAEQVAAVLADSFSRHPVLCDLLGAQGGVLERNVSAEVVARHKRRSLAHLTEIASVLRRHLPELGPGCEPFCFQALVLVGALAPYSAPPPGVLTAYETEPDLAVLHLELRDSLRLGLRTMLLGAAPRNPSS